jgi:putative endonuclease
MPTQKRRLGDFGEMLAKNYLIKKGYRILAQNYQSSYHEIDIIAKIKEKYVFIEVKTRESGFEEPENALNYRKTNNLKKVISAYLGTRPWISEFQLDLIAIRINKIAKIANIKHYKEIF